MSSRQRLVNLAIAAVIAVVAVVVILAGSGNDADTEREAAATPAPTQTQAPDGTRAATPEPTPTPTPDPVPSVRVKAGEVVGGLQTIRADEGDRVRFDVTSDVAEEVHVHAYDIYKDLAAGEPARFSFPATITGIIEVELHGSGLQIAELRVEP